MKKAITNKVHQEQINLALVYVDNNYGANITADDLALTSGYSIFHFHRIFKEIVGQNVNDYIRNTRLEKASNIMLYNQHKTIEQISMDTGFSTATGFSAAFKKKFSMTPKQWRQGGYGKSNSLNTEISMIDVDENLDIGIPIIEKADAIPMMYMRVYGYENDVSKIWGHMNEWSESTGILDNPHKYIGLFHNHPSFKPYNTSRYLACIQTTSNIFRSGKVGKCVISTGRFAKFNFKCKHSELYKLMHLAYIKWLSSSDYEVRNFPAYVEYKNPENLLNNGVLDIDFFMPIQLIT